MMARWLLGGILLQLAFGSTQATAEPSSTVESFETLPPSPASEREPRSAVPTEAHLSRPWVVVGTVAGAALLETGALFAGGLPAYHVCETSGWDRDHNEWRCASHALAGAGVGMVVAGTLRTPAIPYWLDGERGSYWAAATGAAVGGLIPFAAGGAYLAADEIPKSVAMMLLVPLGSTFGALMGYYASVPDVGDSTGARRSKEWVVHPTASSSYGGLGLAGRF